MEEAEEQRYQKIANIGEGTYGIVYKAVDRRTNEIVALKKIRMGKFKDGVNVTALREIKLLQELKHENIIELKDVFVHNNNMNLVYEFMDTDLEAVIKDPTIIMTAADIKSFMQMLLKGVEFCHRNWVLHRDLKPGNLLLSSEGIMKLADFGLARTFGSPDRRLTSQVVTRWYRPPELLFGADLYGPSVDMWSVGCIFAELMLKTPYFPGENDIDQLAKIFAALGTPKEEQWPNMKSLPLYMEFEDFPPTPFKRLFTAASDEAIDLLSKMLVYNPSERISAEQALQHPYFTTGPDPTAPHLLPRPRKVHSRHSGHDYKDNNIADHAVLTTNENLDLNDPLKAKAPAGDGTKPPPAAAVKLNPPTAAALATGKASPKGKTAMHTRRPPLPEDATPATLMKSISITSAGPETRVKRNARKREDERTETPLGEDDDEDNNEKDSRRRRLEL